MRCTLAAACLPAVLAIPAEPHWFEQTIDHFSTSTASFRQRYYANESHFKGPGSPFFVILGGEGGISPQIGIFYPWVVEVLAASHGALVLEPEHRFYGESLPFGEASFSPEHLRVMNTQQALADAAAFIRAQQEQRGCTGRGTPGYCPVLTIGGSYPGFLSAMMRLRYPAVVDMAYAASAPIKFYTQEVDQRDYYARVTESAERAFPGCAQSVRAVLGAAEAFFAHSEPEVIARRFRLCSSREAGRGRSLGDDLLFLAEQAFANLNMANYPPGNLTGLYKACAAFHSAASHGEEAMLDAVRQLLGGEIAPWHSAAGKTVLEALQAAAPLAKRQDDCLDLASQLPAGPNATARCGDWSGCGAGHDGEMWDYQTCTFEVEMIGFGSSRQMFPEKPWSREWLDSHCMQRFGVTPQPRALADLWGFDEAGLRAQASRIVFTNGLNDGWSVGGILVDLAPERGLVAINMPNGAHHSDLGHFSTEDETSDIKEAHNKILVLVDSWLRELRQEAVMQQATAIQSTEEAGIVV